MTTPPATRRNRLRPFALLFAFALLGGSLLACFIWSQYTGSLPLLDGERAVSGITAPVKIERDARGIPTLRADNRSDLAFATGFVHGQDRFFQMDLLRRHSAGELAELLGRAAASEDVRMRVHRFRTRATAEVERFSPHERDLLAAYVAGVEAGRTSLKSKPWEYHLLRAEPAAWRAEDTALVVFAMYTMLQDNSGERERAQGLIAELLPEPLAKFLSPAGSVWDAPLIGDAWPNAPIPDASVIDLRKDSERWIPPKAPKAPPRMVPGSNNWAVDARHTSHGGAILACDMHLGLMAPGIWYRAAFEWQGKRIVGATLPGTPAMVVGSNGQIAWGFTNVEADTSDQVVVITDTNDPESYRTPAGVRRYERFGETIRVKGGKDITITVKETIWGPIVGEDHQQRPLALNWVAHHPGAMNLDLLAMESATSVEEALTIGPTCGSPAQNLVVADRKGHIGWTVLGRLPHRIGFDGRMPVSWADGSRRWDGFLPTRLYPRVVDPPTGRLWTANNRTMPMPGAGRIGISSYDIGARAQQIRDKLLSLERASEADMLALQLDDKAVFLERWQRVCGETLDAMQADDRAESMRKAVKEWGARADPDSVGYRLVRQFRREVMQAVFGSLTAPCQLASPRFSYRHLDANIDQSVWLLAMQKPAHLLPPEYLSWEELFAACIARVADSVKGPGSFEDRLRSWTWGEANRARIGHPLASALGPLAQWMNLNMPADPLPGDAPGVVRAQWPNMGASQRMAVSPGREEEGYFHMPAGQSGHPLSPHYRDGHDDWVKGRATPFLPGPVVHVLELTPR